jgi:predicted dehydrogenase
MGPIIEVDARTEILWPAVKLTDTGEESLRETADHVAVLGKTQSGAVFTADIHGGVAPQDTRSSFEIRGSEAWLSLTSDHPYGIHAGDPTLRSNIPLVIPDEPAAINVGEIYVQLVRDLREGTCITPGFQHALHNARLVEAVRRAGERGERQQVLEEVESFQVSS